jgi:nicastrin
MAAIARVSELPLLLLLLLSLLLAPLLAHGRSASSVPELEKRMYASLAGSPCVRWLNLTGELGCGNPSRTLVGAPIRRVEDKLDSPGAVLVSARAFREFVDRVRDDENVVGVLVENGTSSPEFQVSDDVTFPQAEFAPYENRSWIWNSAGSGIMQRRFNFPVFLLSPVSGVNIFLKVHVLDSGVL